MYACRIVLFLVINLAMLTYSLVTLVFLFAILTALINRVQVLSWNILLFEGHFMGAITEA